MTVELVQTIGKYLIAFAVVIGCFIQISQPGDHAPAYGLLGIIVGWIVNAAGVNSGATNAVKAVTASK